MSLSVSIDLAGVLGGLIQLAGVTGLSALGWRLLGRRAKA